MNPGGSFSAKSALRDSNPLLLLGRQKCLPLTPKARAGEEGSAHIHLALMKFCLTVTSVIATRIGLEPTTSAVTGRRDNQLRYRAKEYTAKPASGLEPETWCLRNICAANCAIPAYSCPIQDSNLPFSGLRVRCHTARRIGRKCARQDSDLRYTG